MPGPISKKPPGALERQKKEIRERLNIQMEQEVQRLIHASSGDSQASQQPHSTAAAAADNDGLIREQAAKLSRLLDSKTGNGGAVPNSSLSGGADPAAATSLSPANLQRSLSPARQALSSPLSGSVKTSPSSPDRPARARVSPVRAIANMQGIVQDAWAMAHEDMAEMLRDKEWERRKKRALQSMRKEYEDERRRELEEEGCATLAGMSAELWQDSAATREKLVLELQHETTTRVWQLQQQAQEVYVSQVEELSAQAKTKAAAQIRQLRATHKAQRDAQVEARRKELKQQQERALEEAERRLAKDAGKGLETLQEALKAKVEGTSTKIEDAYEQHLREERDRKLQDSEGRLETLRRETIAAEEERLAFLMETLESRLRRGTDEAKRRVATYVQTMFPRRDEAECKSEGGLGALPPLPFSGDGGETSDDEEEKEKDATPSEAKTTVDSEVIRWVASLQAWLDSGCEKLSVAVGDLARERALLKKQGDRDSGRTERQETDA